MTNLLGAPEEQRVKVYPLAEGEQAFGGAGGDQG